MNIEAIVKKASLDDVSRWARRLKLDTELPDKKLRKLIIAKADATLFSTPKTGRERDAVVDKVEPKTGLVTKQPLGCFGWNYSKDDTLCTKDCQFASRCKELSAEAPAILAELNEEALVDAAVARVGKKEAEAVASGLKSKQPKADAPKAAVATVGMKTKYRAAFDEEVINTLDDKDTRVLYRKVYKRFGDKPFTVGDFKALLESLDYEVTDAEVIEQLDVRASNGDFELVG